MMGTIVQRGCAHFQCLLNLYFTSQTGLARADATISVLALQTLVAVVQHEKALQVAQQAVGTAPDATTAQIALAYAQQVRFDLEGAHQSC